MMSYPCTPRYSHGGRRPVSDAVLRSQSMTTSKLGGKWSRRESAACASPLSTRSVSPRNRATTNRHRVASSSDAVSNVPWIVSDSVRDGVRMHADGVQIGAGTVAVELTDEAGLRNLGGRRRRNPAGDHDGAPLDRVNRLVR